MSYSYGFSGLISSLLGLIAVPVFLIKTIAIIFMAFTLFCIFKNWNKGHNKELMNGMIISTITLILVNVFSSIFIRLIMGYYFKVADGLAPLLAIIITAIIYFVANSNGDKIYPNGYFDNISNSEFLKAEFSNSINYLISSLKREGNNFENRAFYENSNKYRNEDYSSREGENHRNAYNKYAYGYGYNLGPAPFRGYLKDDWSFLIYIVLSFITCGLYHYYFIYKSAESINIACNGDGEETSGLLKFIVFSVLTCGLYSLFWYFSFMNRLEANGPRYGRLIQDNGATFLLWFIIGSWFCGIGPFIALYFFIKNLNIICNAYNVEHAGNY